MVVFEFVQLYVGFPDPENATSSCSPAHTVRLPGGLTVGRGLMVIENVTGSPVQGPWVGVTVILAVCTVVTLALGKLIFPLPEASRPMAVLSFVQVNPAPGEPEKGTDTVCPAQTSTSLG